MKSFLIDLLNRNDAIYRDSFTLVFSDENNISKLVRDMWENWFSRLCQLSYNWIQTDMIFKNSCPQIFYKLGVLRYFAKFTWNHPRPAIFKEQGRPFSLRLCH